MKFSERKGYKEVRTELQYEYIDNGLRAKLWNVLNMVYFEDNKIDFIENHSNLNTLFTSLYHNFFKLTLDSKPLIVIQEAQNIKKYIMNSKWYEVFDLIEFIPSACPDEEKCKIFKYLCNSALEEEKSAYRFVDDKIVEITSEEEISEIEESIESTQKYPNVNEHLKRSLELLSDKKDPDYRNSIKESISSVEAICQNITGEDNTSLGQCIKKLRDNGVEIHGALESAFSSIYGYTSSSDGIRHALLEKDDLKFEDAKFMLVICSSFVNYLKAKSI